MDNLFIHNIYLLIKYIIPDLLKNLVVNLAACSLITKLLAVNMSDNERF